MTNGVIPTAHVSTSANAYGMLNNCVSNLITFLGTHVEDGTVSSIGNYIVTGLASHLLKGAKVRFFEASRTPDTLIQPHSHRYCLFSMVLRGKVRHTVYKRSPASIHSEEFAVRKIEFVGEDADGNYRVQDINENNVEYAKFSTKVTDYSVGESYFITSDEIHSVQFSSDAILLILEGSELKDSSVILEPVTNYEGTTLNKDLSRVPRENYGDPENLSTAEDTFQVSPHMFKKVYNE